MRNVVKMASKLPLFAAKSQKSPRPPSTVTKYSVTILWLAWVASVYLAWGLNQTIFVQKKKLLLIHSSQQNLGCVSGSQGRREPNVGPRSAQILGISGFICYKTEKKYVTIISRFWSPKKEGLQGETARFFLDLRWSPKKKIFDFPQTDL